MIGILAGSYDESKTGHMFVYQAMHAPVTTYLWLVLWVVASMIPLLKGARLEPFGIFTPRAEVANGRAAMIGFAVILALEYKTGVPFW
jgi:hypothetical protein